MSPRRATAEPGTGARTAIGALLVVLVAVGMMLLVRASPDTTPFDPRSESATGTRGLVVLLQRFGADVDVSRTMPSGGDARRVLVLQDRLNDDQRGELARFVRSGGVVVMADPDSPLAGPRGTGVIEGTVPIGNVSVTDESNVLPGRCDIGALQHLRGLFVPDGVELVAQGDVSCFGDGVDAFAVVRADGDGSIIALGDNELFTNRYLRFADNAGLATALLAPIDGAAVTIVLGAEAPKTTADIGTGDTTLLELVRPGVWMALTQLVVAFAVLAVARAIRPGRPVREPDQVPIAGSELVVATGRLMQRAQHAERAGWLLRGNLHRELCVRMRLPPNTPIDELDAVVASRTTVPAGHVEHVLRGDPRDAQELLALSHRIQEIRDLVLEGASQ